MVRARPALAKAFLIAALAVLLALLSAAYSDLTAEQQIAAIYVAKVLLSSLAAALLLAFQIRWILMKHDLSILGFYTKWKFFKYNVAMAAGMVLLAAAFFLDLAQYAGWVSGTGNLVATNLLEAVALIFFGYSYYKLLRLEGL